MSEDNRVSPGSPIVVARTLLRTAFKGSLATLSAEDGGPYASLVLVATDTRGSALMLLSKLALHSRNLAADARASLMIDGTDGLGDPMAGGRVTFTGTVKRIEDGAARRRFLARHTSAAGYADFPDFGLYRLDATSAHVIEGFGRIRTIAGEAVRLAEGVADAVAAAEPDLLADLAAHAFGDEGWRCTGIDPEGVDLVSGALARRMHFPRLMTNPIEIVETIRAKRLE
jgi:hypothetical protein